MLQILQVLQLTIGGLMILAIGALLYLNLRWKGQSPTGDLEDENKEKMDRYVKMAVIFLVIPNVILIFLTRGLS